MPVTHGTVMPSSRAYLQWINIHRKFVNNIEIRIFVMTCPKSFLFMYTSTNIPTYVAQVEEITVIM